MCVCVCTHFVGSLGSAVILLIFALFGDVDLLMPFMGMDTGVDLTGDVCDTYVCVCVCICMCVSMVYVDVLIC